MKYLINMVFILVIVGCLAPLKGKDKMEADRNLEKATFAGGCFWCMEGPFEELEGVINVIAGYTGGHVKDPTYEQVCSGTSGHIEAVEITFDPSIVSYETLLDIFWRQIDPTDKGGQFVDRGEQYATVIFYHSEEQRKIAEQSRKKLEESGLFSKPIVTAILPAKEFYPAEDYHQDYYRKNPLRYKFYRMNSGRDSFIKTVWDKYEKQPEGNHQNKPSQNELKRKLTPLQYHVTQEKGTEPPFENEYYSEKRAGIYVDVVTGEPLFLSLDKYDSGSGWPSFTKPISPDRIVEKEDNSLFMKRVEIRSKSGNTHLGHVFSDGPEPTGMRYCVNSASLRFIPLEDLEKEGYGEYLKYFERREGSDR